MFESRSAIVIVDSSTSLYRSDHPYRGDRESRQIHFGQFIRSLQRLAYEFDVAVVITNRVEVDHSVNVFSSPQITGDGFPRTFTARLHLRKGKGSIEAATSRNILLSLCLKPRSRWNHRRC